MTRILLRASQVPCHSFRYCLFVLTELPRILGIVLGHPASSGQIRPCNDACIQIGANYAVSLRHNSHWTTRH